jgi:hypothetical protein
LRRISQPNIDENERISLIDYNIILEKRLYFAETSRLEAEKKWNDSPMSLFGPLGTKVPDLLPFKFDDDFVNRKNELSLAWKTMIFAQRNGNDNAVKNTLLVTGQMFGSGKTTFGRNLFNFENSYICGIYSFFAIITFLSILNLSFSRAIF